MINVMANPTTDNKLADFINGIINALIVGGEAAAEAYIISLDPTILAIPVVKVLIEGGLKYIGGFVYAYLARGATNLVIDIQTNGEQSKAVIAATALQMAIASGDQNVIKKAAQDASTAYGNLIHWDGSTT